MGDTPVSICVLLAAYNGSEWIEEQVKSILAQKNAIVTIFISVDLCADSTYKLVKSLELTCENINVLPYGIRYGGAAPNFFRLIKDVEFSCFDFVAFSDQDDIWFEWKLEKAILTLQDSDYIAYSSDVTAFWPNGEKQYLKKSYKQCEFDHYFEAPGPGCTFVFTRKALAEFKSDMVNLESCIQCITVNHDWFLYAYFRSKGHRWHIDDVSSMMYRQHYNNEVGINSGFKGYLLRLKMVRSHWYRLQVKNIVESLSPEFKPKLFNRFFLIIHFYKLRRRPRDKLALLIMLILGLF